jgi:hypothetical protein
MDARRTSNEQVEGGLPGPKPQGECCFAIKLCRNFPILLPHIVNDLSVTILPITGTWAEFNTHYSQETMGYVFFGKETQVRLAAQRVVSFCQLAQKMCRVLGADPKLYVCEVIGYDTNFKFSMPLLD